MDRNNQQKKSDPSAKRIDIYKTFIDENRHVFDKKNDRIQKAGDLNKP